MKQNQKCDYCNNESINGTVEKASAYVIKHNGRIVVSGSKERIKANWEDGNFWYTKKCIICEENRYLCGRTCPHDNDVCNICKRDIILTNIIEK